MKPRHLTWLVTAAALSAGLSAFAQQTPPAGTETEPGQQTPQTEPYDAERGVRPGERPATLPAPSAEDRTATTDDMGRPYDRDGSAEQPKKKRTFWDRITGRNKHLDADAPAAETQPETRPQP